MKFYLLKIFTKHLVFSLFFTLIVGVSWYPITTLISFPWWLMELNTLKNIYCHLLSLLLNICSIFCSYFYWVICIILLTLFSYWLYSSSKLPWLFFVFHVSMWILGLSVNKKKMYIDFDWDCIEFVSRFGKNWKIDSLNCWIWYISPFPHTLFNFFWQFLWLFNVEDLHIY